MAIVTASPDEGRTESGQAPPAHFVGMSCGTTITQPDRGHHMADKPADHRDSRSWRNWSGNEDTS